MNKDSLIIYIIVLISGAAKKPYQTNKMSSFLDLPDELILKVFSYTETADILRCGQVSKRIRNISNDNSLFQIVNLSGKNVKTELLATALNKGCKNLILSDSSIWGNLNLIQKSKLRDDQSEQELVRNMFFLLNTKQITKFDLLSFGTQFYAYDSFGRLVCSHASERITTINDHGELFQRVWLSGKYVKIFLEHLSLDGLQLTPKLLNIICQNCQTMQVYTLNEGICYKNLKISQKLFQLGYRKNFECRN